MSTTGAGEKCHGAVTFLCVNISKLGNYGLQRCFSFFVAVAENMSFSVTFFTPGCQFYVFISAVLLIEVP